MELTDTIRNVSLISVVESLVFAADEPVSGLRIKEVYTDVTGLPCSETDVEDAVSLFNAAAEEQERAVRIFSWGGGFRIATVQDYAPFLRAMFVRDREQRLSRSTMETLAILAYRQPVTKPEIDFVRGVDSDYGIRKLLDLGLVDVVGRSESLGRPLLYGTTVRFLEQFGIASLDDLPQLREIQELLNDPSFRKERAQLLALDAFETESPESAPAEDPDEDNIITVRSETEGDLE